MSIITRHMTPDGLIDSLLRPETNPRWLVTHLLANADDPVDFERSIANCHVPGLDSVVIHDWGPGNGMVRFYYAHPGKHTLNDLYGPDGHFTVGVHNHRYRIAKIPLVGPLVNVRTKVRGPVTARRHGPTLHEYEFSSGISGEMGVKHRREVRIDPLQPDLLMPGEAAVMAPEELHTVVVSRTRLAAWLVIEGANTPDFTPLIYSPRLRLKLSDKGLYEPMDEATVRERIRSVRTLA